MEPISRSEARKRGLLVFFTGKKCCYNHAASRYVSNGMCRECSNLYTKERDIQYPNRTRKGDQQKNYERKLRPRSWAALSVSGIKYRARKTNIPFNLTTEYILSLMSVSQFCPALHIPLIFGRARTDNSMSIDRIIPSLGYVIGNVVIISFRANRLKGNSVDPDELRKIASFMDTTIKAANELFRSDNFTSD